MSVESSRGGVRAAPWDGMKQILDVETCVARACRLMVLADEATDYEMILTYDALAKEWLELATRCPRATDPAPAEPHQPPTAAARTRRKLFWFL